MELVIDDRETKLKNILQDSCVKYELLDVADAHVKVDGKAVLLIERKTNSDMQSSLIDGRYKEQKNRMKATGLPVLYILEGDSFLHPKDPSTIEKALQSVELDLSLSNKSQLVRTKNVEQTANFLLLCVKYFSNIPNLKHDTCADEDLLCIKRTKCVTDANILKIMLCQIPGVSIKTSNAISSHYNSSPFVFFSKLTDNTSMIEEITNINTGTRKIGKSLAQKIVGMLGYNV